MKASVILAHPYQQSFNHAIYEYVLEVLQNRNVEVFSHDLYEENFNPVLTKKELGTDSSDDALVNQYARELVESDFIVFIHPNWWGQPPAILKGYIDRVVRPPYAYDFEVDQAGGLPIKKLNIRYGIVYNTSNTNEDREKDYFGDPLENIWGRCIFGFLGVEKYCRKTFGIIADSSQEQRKKWLESIVLDIDKIMFELEKNGRDVNEES